jgi:ABC-2 type transport system permease protein
MKNANAAAKLAATMAVQVTMYLTERDSWHHRPLHLEVLKYLREENVFGAVAFHAVAASLLLSLLGVLGGIWADKFDHIATVTNFVVTPLSFLSGTFYSIERLPPPWHAIALWNPFFYMIDGFRYGFIGRADGEVWAGVAVMLAINAALLALCHSLIARGYKLKA